MHLGLSTPAMWYIENIVRSILCWSVRKIILRESSGTIWLKLHSTNMCKIKICKTGISWFIFVVNLILFKFFSNNILLFDFLCYPQSLFMLAKLMIIEEAREEDRILSLKNYNHFSRIIIIFANHSYFYEDVKNFPEVIFIREILYLDGILQSIILLMIIL